MSEDMENDPLKRLKGLDVPAASETARARALASAMSAFEAAQAAETEKNAGSTQGSDWLGRLKSIFTSKRTWAMDYRIPLGTAAVALLLFPLGLQLYSTTSMTPPPEVAKEAAPSATVATPSVTVAAPEAATAKKQDAPPQPEAAPAPEPAKPAVAEDEAAAASGQVQSFDALSADAAPAQAKMRAESPAAPMTMNQSAMLAPQMLESAPMPAPVSPLADASAPPMATTPSGDVFTRFAESPVRIVKEAPVSTFSIDVDTASYSYVRRMLAEGFVPPPEAVRIEEMINYFPYDYPAPASASEPFKPAITVYPTPWNPKTELLHIGIRGYAPPPAERKASNLVFLIDTSGSMDEPDKLPLLKRAFALLVDQLGPKDTVSIVAYAGSAGVVLEPTHAAEKATILKALDALSAGGSTAGAEGIELAYRLAEENRLADGNNRVILATDGDFNVGIDDPEALKDFIKAKREGGTFLSVLGFGQGNLDDATMQALAQNGNGNASYIDSFREAQKVLVDEIGGTLETIARDVKIQVEFNPAFVSEYRLIGYETRALQREDFNNDKVDAGDVGAGTTVTAIYEITPKGSGAELADPLRYQQQGEAVASPQPKAGDELAFLKMRYKLPGAAESTLIETPVTGAMMLGNIAEASDDVRFATAVAAFAQKLRGSNYGGEMSWDQIRALAQGARGADDAGYRAEFVQMLGTAAALEPDSKP